MNNYLINENKKVTEFSWGGIKEYFLNFDLIQITNIHIGTYESSFMLKDKEYNLIISETKIENKEITFEGIPKLSGSEEDNLFLEEMEEGFKRSYSLRNQKLAFNSSLFNDKKYIYVYLN